MNYSPIYKKFIDDKNAISANRIQRNKFYLIKEYTYVDGEKSNYTSIDAPIVYTLFVSKSKDILHCVKVSNVNPNIIKKFFGKFINENGDKLIVKGKATKVYQNTVKKFPGITSDAYRTYKLTGIKKILSLEMDLEKITPKKPIKIQKVPPKPKIQKVPPKPKVPPKK